MQVLSNGVPVLDLDVEDGSMVSGDRASSIRGTCTLILTDPNETLVASTAQSVLTPFGTEVAVYYGITFDDGTQEFCLQGIFEIVDVNPDDTGVDLVITIDGSDRSYAIQKDLFDDYFTIPPNTDVGLAIQSIILDANVSPLCQQFAFAAAGFTTGIVPIVYSPGDDRLDAICNPQTGLAASIGMECFVNPNGIWELIPVPDPSQQPVWWDFDEGNQNIAVELNRTLSSATAYNTVIRAGAGSGITAFPPAVAQDTNPLSPTFIGTVGEWVDYSSSNLYATQAQAQVAANAALLVDLGSVETVVATSVVVPDVAVDKVFGATRVRAGIPAHTLYVVDSFQLGLGTSGTLASTARLVP